MYLPINMLELIKIESELKRGIKPPSRAEVYLNKIRHERVMKERGKTYDK